jgi:hypothetical protein
VERHRVELYRTKERYNMKLHMLLNDPAAPKLWTSPLEKASSLFLPSSRAPLSASCPGSLQNKKLDLKAQVSHQGFQRRDVLTCSDPPNTPIQSSNVIARKRRIQAQVCLLCHVLLYSFRRCFSHYSLILCCNIRLTLDSWHIIICLFLMSDKMKILSHLMLPNTMKNTAV